MLCVVVVGASAPGARCAACFRMSFSLQHTSKGHTQRGEGRCQRFEGLLLRFLMPHGTHASTTKVLRVPASLCLVYDGCLIALCLMYSVCCVVPHLLEVDVSQRLPGRDAVRGVILEQLIGSTITSKTHKQAQAGVSDHIKNTIPHERASDPHTPQTLKPPWLSHSLPPFPPV